MKKIIIILILISSHGIVHAQVDEGNFSINLTHKVAVNNTKLMRNNLTGIDVEWNVADNVGFNYSVYGGEGVFHMPAGPAIGVAAVCVAACFWTGGGLDFESEMLLIFAIPEGVTYNFEIAQNTYISPYINPLGLEYHDYPEDENRWFGMGSAGTKIKMFMPIENEVYVVFSGFAEAQLEYTSDQQLGVRAGLSCGISF